MTASAHGGEHVTSAAARLASGGGVAAVATSRADGSPAALGPLLHGMAPDGSLLVLVGGTAVPPEVADGSRYPQAVIMVDDFAPILEVKVHVGSLRGIGALRPVEDHEFVGHPLRGEATAWPGSRLLAVETMELTLTRLGVSVDLAVETVRSARIDPLSEQAHDVIEAIRVVHGRRLPSLVEGCRVHGSASPGESLHLLSVDVHGMHVLAEGPDGMGIHRLPFRRRTEDVGDVLAEVAALCDAAHPAGPTVA